MIEVFDEEMVKECLSEVEDCKEKQYAFWLLDWAMQKRKINAIPIKLNATNGSMFIETFNPYKVVETEGCDDIYVYLTEFDLENYKHIAFDKNWWDSAYKEKEESND